jgi:hypothetical protein
MAAGDLEVLPGASWTAKPALPWVTGTKGLITVAAPAATYIVAPRCAEADAWVTSNDTELTVFQNSSGTAEVCYCIDGICRAMSPAGDAAYAGWDLVVVVDAPAPSYTVEARGMYALESSVLSVAHKFADHKPDLDVGCAQACSRNFSATSATSSLLQYELPASKIDRTDLCIDGVFIGPLFISGVDKARVRAEGMRIIVPGLNMTSHDRIALTALGSACSDKVSAILSPAVETEKSSQLEFVAPEGRYKVCFCDAQQADCSALANFFEVSADLLVGAGKGLTCLTSVPRLLQPHCRPMSGGSYKCQDLQSDAVFDADPISCGSNATAPFI